MLCLQVAFVGVACLEVQGTVSAGERGQIVITDVFTSGIFIFIIIFRGTSLCVGSCTNLHVLFVGQCTDAVRCQQFAVSCLQVAFVGVACLEAQGTVSAGEWGLAGVTSQVLLKPRHNRLFHTLDIPF